MAISPETAGLQSQAAEPRAGSLADVLDVILDKGLVIDAFVRVSLVGIEVVTIDARIVVASVETYMHFAREANRLQLGGGQGSVKQGLAGAMMRLEEGGAHSLARGALRGAGEGLREGIFGRREEPRPRRGVAGVVQRTVNSIREALTPDEEEGQGGRAQLPTEAEPVTDSVGPAPHGPQPEDLSGAQSGADRIGVEGEGPAPPASGGPQDSPEGSTAATGDESAGAEQSAPAERGTTSSPGSGRKPTRRPPSSAEASAGARPEKRRPSERGVPARRRAPRRGDT